MGTSRGNSRAHLLIDESVWATEATAEEAVLAEFADEGALAPASASSVTASEPVQRAHPALRLLSPHTPLKEVVRTVLVGCVSAMALGASFAIGFGYVWSERASSPASPAGQAGSSTDTNNARPYRGWWLPFPQAPPPTQAGPSASRPSEGRERAAGRTEPKRSNGRTTSSAVPANPTTRSDERSGARSETTRDVGLDRASAPGASEETASAVRASEILPSEPMLSAESTRVAEPAPLPLMAAPFPRSETRNESGFRASRATATVPRRADVDEVRSTIERYQTAYSQKDLGAMALVWPSLDVAGVAKAFATVDRQALILNDCRVTTAGDVATAVCPGQVRYVGRVGGRQMQERQGTWTIALERNGETWQFTRLNVR